MSFLKVSQLIEKLGEYNPDAEVDVIAMNRRQEFSLSWWSGGEGGTKEQATSVSFYVDDLNQSESAG